MDISSIEGVAIGNLRQDVDISLRNCLIKCNEAGKKLVSLGSLDGKSVKLRGHDMGIILNDRAHSTVGIGCMNGKTEVDIASSFFKFNGSGDSALCYGGYTEDTKVCFTNCDINIELTTKLNKLTNAPDSNLVFNNVRNVVNLNGEEII